MAEKKSEAKSQFEAEVYKLGLKLIEDYKTGTCADRTKTPDAIIEIFGVSQQRETFFNGGKSHV